MVFEEAKMEFIPIETKDVIATSGAEIHICGGVSFDDDCDPSNNGSL